MTGNLLDIRHMDCEKIPSQSFKVLQVARFIKLDMETFYVKAGFKFVNVDYKDPICGRNCHIYLHTAATVL